MKKIFRLAVLMSLLILTACNTSPEEKEPGAVVNESVLGQEYSVTDRSVNGYTIIKVLDNEESVEYTLLKTDTGAVLLKEEKIK